MLLASRFPTFGQIFIDKIAVSQPLSGSFCVMHSVWWFLHDWICMMHVEQCMMHDAWCIMQEAWCMMIKNVIIKLEDYLVVTNIWGSSMMPDAFSKMHYASWMMHDTSCMINNASCMMLQNLIHKFEDYLVLTKMWNTCKVWCVMH